jgi:DNA-directed RNA polymerase III subunit RPC4
LDVENKKLHVLGEVNKRFVVSPDLDTLLSFVELADNDATTFDNGDLIKMDTV